MSNEHLPLGSQSALSLEKAAFLKEIIPKVNVLEREFVIAEIDAMNGETFATMRKESGDQVDNILEGLRLARQLTKLTESMSQLKTNIDRFGGTVDLARKQSEELSQKKDKDALKNILQPWFP